MTREEKQKAIDALKISAPIMAVTQEEFKDYIQTLNKIMDWLEQEPKTGHWKHDRSNVRCSSCGRGYKEAVGRTSATTYNFCPNCGADMREMKK